MSYISVDSRWRLFGEEGWRVSLNLDKALIRSALIYDDRLVILYRTPDGHNAEMNMGLWPGYQDVMSAIRVRARDSDDQSGWSYLRLSYAGGEPDLTPQKIKGTKGDDVLYGGFGADVIKGGKGDDILHGERVADNHWVGGNDRLEGGKGNDVLFGYRGDDTLIGGKGDDVLNGGIGADRLNGGAGDDQLDGGTGDDVLRGRNGNDRLIGGKGDDVISDGEGTDIFYIFLTYREALLNGTPIYNHDQVTDFEVGIDKIALPAKHYAHQDLSIRTLAQESGDLIGLVVQINGHEANNSLTVAFTEHFSTAEFNELVDEAGSLNELLLEVV